ncbi:MAG TPA: glycosyltransferase, partial [Gallionella sp.]|nr:glycosyltransferase [Gallionella sp.]
YIPDVICAHPGWGEALFIKEVWPEVPLLNYIEFYYQAHGSDIDFDPEFSAAPDETPRLIAKNFTQLMSLEQCDAGVAPTQWQKSTFPPGFQRKIRVIHEGVNTDAIAPAANAQIALREKGLVFRPGDEVMTFVNRSLEPYRGYHSFVRAIPEIQRRRPHAHIVMVGADEGGYGRQPPKGTTWRAHFLNEVSGEIDFRRLHFVGYIPYDALVSLMQVSAVHVYLTYPFVLSWSMIEAMSAGCLVVGSKTAPVEEVISDGENGLLVDFFSPADIAGKVATALASPSDFTDLRRRARETVIDRYDLHRICLPQHLAYIDELAGKSR